MCETHSHMPSERQQTLTLRDYPRGAPRLSSARNSNSECLWRAYHTPAPALDILRLIRISTHPYYTHLADEEAEAHSVKSAFSMITRLSGRFKASSGSNRSLWKQPAGQVPEAPSLSFPPHLPNGAAGGQVSPEGLWSVPVM